MNATSTRGGRLAVRVLLVTAVSMALWTSAARAQSVEQDLAYGADPAQRLDLSTPAAPGFSTVIFVHGGSLTSGDKGDSDYGKVCAPFAAAGIGCANVNYRLAPAHAWPAQAEDVAAGIAWVRDNIAARGGDPGRLILIGHSSGAMLVALLGADTVYLSRHGLGSSALRGVIAMGSIMSDDDLERALAQRSLAELEERFRRNPSFAMYSSLAAYRDRWPMRHLRKGMPPYLFLIAETETENPPVLRTNQAFADSAVALGNTADYLVLPARNHYGVVRRLHEPGDPVFEILREFVRRVTATPSP